MWVEGGRGLEEDFEFVGGVADGDDGGTGTRHCEDLLVNKLVMKLVVMVVRNAAGHSLLMTEAMMGRRRREGEHWCD